MRTRTRIITCALLYLLTTASARSADWPAWRGPGGQGICTEQNLPLTWGGKDGANVHWKVRLPGTEGKANLDQNQSSPIVMRGLVFVTTSFWPAGVERKEYPEHHVLCYRLADGKLLWNVTVPPGPWKLSDLRGGYTAPTPAADAERVYVIFGSAVLAALDHDGKILWRKELTPYDFDVAFACSPVLFGDVVFLQCDGLKKTSRLMAFDRKTGEVRWEQKRPGAGFAHSTPVVATIAGKSQLLVAGSSTLQGVDPSDGKVLWSSEARGDTVSPVLAGGLVYIDSGRGGRGAAVDPTGSGDVTKTHLKWKDENVPEGFSSPVAAGGYLYRLHNPGMLRCYRPDTGAIVFDERIPNGVTAASPIVTADGRIYLATAGRSYVLRAGPKLEILARNDLDDASQASPAVSEGNIILRGRNYLYCIRKKD
jgi:outer membrane protein assembly factor BamB